MAVGAVGAGLAHTTLRPKWPGLACLAVRTIGTRMSRFSWEAGTAKLPWVAHAANGSRFAWHT